MKNRTVLILLLLLTISAETVGAILNYVVISANGGMPTIGIQEAFSKWVPLNPQTKLAFLADIIRVGNYVVSIGDLLFITGIVTNMIAIWIAMPYCRKFFPILLASLFGILFSIAEVNHQGSILFFETAAIATILAIYFKYRTTLKDKKLT